MNQPKKWYLFLIKEGIEIANKIISSSYKTVFCPGGRGMEIIYNIKDLKLYLNKVLSFSNESILIDQYLTNAIEVDVDAMAMERKYLFR